MARHALLLCSLLVLTLISLANVSGQEGEVGQTTWEVEIHSPMNGGYIGTDFAVVSAEFISEERQLVAVEVRLNQGPWEGGVIEGSTESVHSHYGVTIVHELLVGNHLLQVRHHLDDGTTFSHSLDVKVGNSVSPPILKDRTNHLSMDESILFVASHPEGISDVVGTWFIRGTPMEMQALPLISINGTDGMASRTTEARYAPEIPLGCPCAFVVEATSTNGHISRFISENMTTQWTRIPLMVDSVPGWIEPREGTVIDSWQSVEPILQLTGWSLFVDHIDFRPTILNRCDVVPENVSTTRVTTIQSLNSYTDGALILRLTSTENPLLWNECRILFLDRNIPVGSLTTENQVSQVSNTGVMVNLSVQDIGFNIVQDGSINWTHSLLVGGYSLPFEVLEQGRKIRINTSTPGEHVVRVTIEDIAGNTLRLEIIIEIRPVEPLMQILVDGIPHPDSEILQLENGTTLSIKFDHPVFNEADYDVRWSLNEVVVATGYNVDIEQTWFNHQGDKLELEVEHPEGKAVHVVNITLQSGNKELMAEQSEPTDAWIFGLSVIHLLALLVLLVTAGLIFRWLARYHYTVPSWGNEPPSGQ